jgi:flagellar protein FliS
MLASTAMPRHTAHSHAGAYRQVGVETGVGAASPHQLVTMLFEGFVDAIVQARAAMQQRQIEAKCSAISRAVRIVDEVLKAALDCQGGGTLAENLRALYGYLALRLTHANLHNDAAALDECQALIEPVRSAWAAIAPAAPGAEVQ